ncbi:MAG: Ig-like domain-containing protein, partial [Abditibacteriales bacterium]|nr:Ig-like domain-containing protein [Abditibacteriales bacterium]
MSEQLRCIDQKMVKSRLFLACLFAALLFSACAHAQTPFRPRLRVDPDILPANGISTATVTVVVYDSAGFPVSDGTPVAFTTTLGTIEPPTTTLLRRTARATLRSPTTPGVARVSVTVGSGHAEYEVEFVDSETYSRSTRYFSVSGDRDTYIAYGVDAQVITTSGNAEWRFGAITVRTDLKTDFDLIGQVLFAEGTAGENRVTITNGTHTLQGDRLIYHVQRRRGTLFAISPQPRKIVFSGMELKSQERQETTSDDRTTSEEADDPDIITPPEYTATGYWITAQRMTIYPQEKIQFQKAAIYLQGKRLMAWPRYVLPLNGAT